MKKIRRKTMVDCKMMGYFDEEPKMHTLYECHGKYGTHGTSIFWLLAEPKIGENVVGICAEQRYSPYDKGQAFQYAHWCIFEVWDINYNICGNNEPYIFVNLHCS